MLTIRLLGSPQILLDRRPIDVSRRKSRALLYYVAAQDEPVHREHLLNVFWLDSERSSALQTLRTTLHGLRKELANELLADEDAVSLAPGSVVDVRSFRQRLEELPTEISLLEETLDLYRGDFLSDFVLPNTVSFEDWVVIERENYRRLARRGWEALSQLYEASGDFRAALNAIESALAFDPLQEDLQRESIRLLYLAGDRPAAIRRYDQLRKLLDEEMGVPPMAETRDLYDEILKDTLASSGHRTPSQSTSRAPFRTGIRPEPARLPFTGRDAELQMLQSLAASHKLVLIEGDPGIGKTRLAEEFISKSEAIPLSGTARELEHGIPYQPVIEALRSLVTCPDWPDLQSGLRKNLLPLWLNEASRLLPELNPASAPRQTILDQANESRLWEGVNQLLIALAKQRPVILFIDDLHWADTSTLGMLGYLVRQETEEPLLFLAATRGFPARSPVASLLYTLTREGRLERMPLSRLTAEEVTTISQNISPGYAHPLSDWLMRNSEGIPFILNELVRYARENGILKADSKTGEVLNLNALSTSPVVPQTVYNLIQSRLKRLSDSAQRILAAGVATGREFDFEIVARAAALSETTALDALDELQESGVVAHLDATHYRFTHPLIMEVAFQEIGEPRHRLMHRRVAEAMESTFMKAKLNKMAGVIAFHFTEGMAYERAAQYAFKAGKQAARLAAWAEAIEFYKQALMGIEGKERFPILMALGDAYYQAGQSVQSSDIFHEALTLAMESEKLADINTARLGLARSLLAQARYEEAIDLAASVRKNGRREDAMQAEFIWGTSLSLEGADLESATSHLKKAEALCKELHPQEAAAELSPLDEETRAVIASNYFADMARIEFELGSIAAQQGDLPRAVELYQQALEAARQSKSEQGIIWCVLAQNNLAYHLHLMNDPSAIQYAQSGLKLAQEKGMLGQQPYLYSTLGEIALSQGHIDEAEKNFKQGLSIAEKLSIAERVAGLTANLGLVAERRGQTSLAIHRLSTALAQAESLKTLHLAARIRLWLVPLLPPEERDAHLSAVRTFARSSGRRWLLEQASRLEEDLSRD